MDSILIINTTVHYCLSLVIVSVLVIHIVLIIVVLMSSCVAMLSNKGATLLQMLTMETLRAVQSSPLLVLHAH